LKGLAMASKSTATTPKTTKVKELASAKRNLAKNGQDISLQVLLDMSTQVDIITEIIVNEMIGSKNKYLIDLMRDFGDNKQ
jgi:hypothetical protein